MDKLRSTVGILAVLASRPMPWLQATLAGGPAGEEDAERGQGLAEYALILAFIAIAVIGAVAFFGEQLLGVLSGQIGSSISNVVQGMP
jgi:Flp pilus assembly pilin Flp